MAVKYEGISFMEQAVLFCKNFVSTFYVLR